MPRSYLYLVVTDYPYGTGEPFLETELFVIAPAYKQVYIVIPHSHRIDHTKMRYALPKNATLIHLKTTAGIKHKIRAALRCFHPSFRDEIKHINGRYKLKFSSFHMRVLIGFMAMGLAFADEMQLEFRKNGHKPEDISIYSYWFFYATAGMALLKEKNPSLHAITRVHGWDCFFERNPGNYLPLRPWVFGVLDRICPVSETGVKYLREKLPEIPSERIRKHYLGIDDIPKPESLIVNPGKLVIVSLAFIDPVKRLEKIAQALQLTKEIEILWVHIGNAPENASFPELQKELETLEENRFVEIAFKGEFSKAQVFDFFRNSRPDLLICTSLSEGLPVSMMEAMAFGIPVISVDVGGVHEIVKDGYNGRLLSAEASPDDMAKALSDFNSLSQIERQRLSDNAYTTYLKYFSAANNYRRFLEEELTA